LEKPAGPVTVNLTVLIWLVRPIFRLMSTVPVPSDSDADVVGDVDGPVEQATVLADATASPRHMSILPITDFIVLTSGGAGRVAPIPLSERAAPLIKSRAKKRAPPIGPRIPTISRPLAGSRRGARRPRPPDPGRRTPDFRNLEGRNGAESVPLTPALRSSAPLENRSLRGHLCSA
jgi:hypothetical protein